MPKAQSIAFDAGKNKMVDDMNREFRDKVCYAVGDVPHTTTYYEATGTVLPNPKSQKATFLISSFRKLAGAYEEFKMDRALQESFKAFQVREPGVEGVHHQCNTILKDVTYNITNVYGEHRERLALVVLMTYHSPLFMEFNETLIRGYLEVVVIGDTGTAKTTLAEAILRATRLGQKITASSSSRAGILYSLDDKINDKRVIRWGILPLNDRQLILIDESQKINEIEWGEMSTVRERGLLQVNRSVTGEHPAQTRLICLCNPSDYKSMTAHVFGVTALTFIPPPDLRRFDLAIVAAKDDVSMDVINELKVDKDSVPQSITPDLLNASVSWAWTRRPDQIKIVPAAARLIADKAREFTSKYASSDIPLVSMDMMAKLARLSTSLAALLHSTDDTHEEIITQTEHVEYVCDLLTEIYDHKNCQYDQYAQTQESESGLNDQDYEEIVKAIEGAEEKEIYNESFQSLFKMLLSTTSISRSDIVARLDIGEKAVNQRIKLLKHFRLVRTGKNGYIKTPRGIQFLKRYLLNLEDQPGTQRNVGTP